MDISFNEINNLCTLGNKHCARWEMAIAKGDKNHHWQLNHSLAQQLTENIRKWRKFWSNSKIYHLPLTV